MASSGLIVNPSFEGELVVSYSSREYGRKAFAIPVHTRAPTLPLIRSLLAHLEPPVEIPVDATLVEHLVRWGILVPADDASGLAVEGVEAETDVAVQTPLQEYAIAPDAKLEIHRALRPATPGNPYRSVRHLLGFLPGHLLLAAPYSGVELPIAWHESGGIIERYGDLCDGTRSLSDLSCEDRQKLLSMGLVREHGTDVARFRDEAALSLGRSGYAVLRNLFTSEFSTTLKRYSRKLFEDGSLTNETSPGIVRLRQHNNPVMQAVHRALGPVISSITEPNYGPCVPSYCYFSIYQRGAELPRHTDRQQCRWNLSIMLDVEPLVPRDQQWPIHLEVDGKAVEIRLGIGDGLLYSGTDIPHWRSPLDVADFVGVCFFHFVDTDFEGSLD